MARRREDGVRNSWNQRWQCRFANASRRVVAIDKVRLDHERRFVNAQQRILMVVGLRNGPPFRNDSNPSWC